MDKETIKKLEELIEKAKYDSKAFQELKMFIQRQKEIEQQDKFFKEFSEMASEHLKKKEQK